MRAPVSRGPLPALALGLAMTAPPAAADCGKAVPATVETDRGAIHIELDRAGAPQTVANFLAYARDGFYANTVFHRVIPGFMIQGGGLTADLERKPTRAPVVNEADNGRSNTRGTLAMARTSDPDSATSQFFINLADNSRLDGGSGGAGYTVFARVTGGMAVVDAIAGVETATRGGRRDVPVEPVTIEAVTLGECASAGNDGGQA